MLLLSVLIITACTAAPPVVVNNSAQDEADIQAIKEIEAKWDAATNAGDPDVLLGLLTDDVILMNPNEPIKEGKEAVRIGILADFEEIDYENLKSIVAEVRLAGDWAYARGTWSGTVTSKAGGESFQDTGKWIDIFERQPGGSWKVSRDMYNSDLPVPESAD